MGIGDRGWLQPGVPCIADGYLAQASASATPPPPPPYCRHTAAASPPEWKGLCRRSRLKHVHARVYLPHCLTLDKKDQDQYLHWRIAPRGARGIQN